MSNIHLHWILENFVKINLQYEKNQPMLTFSTFRKKEKRKGDFQHGRHCNIRLSKMKQNVILTLKNSRILINVGSDICRLIATHSICLETYKFYLKNSKIINNNTTKEIRTALYNKF